MPHETLKTVDLDVTETEELTRLVSQADAAGAYLHIEVRKADAPEPERSQAELEIRQAVGWLNVRVHDRTGAVREVSRILGNLALLVAQRDNALRDWAQYVHEIEDTERARKAERSGRKAAEREAANLQLQVDWLIWFICEETERLIHIEARSVTRVWAKVRELEAEVERLAADLIAAEEELASETARADGLAASLLGARIARETLGAECSRLRQRLTPQPRLTPREIEYLQNMPAWHDVSGRSIAERFGG